jgi:hypothetical protein
MTIVLICIAQLATSSIVDEIVLDEQGQIEPKCQDNRNEYIFMLVLKGPCYNLQELHSRLVSQLDSACGSKVLHDHLFSVLRSQSAKTENKKRLKYRSAACPELVEGKAKMPTA